MLEPHLLFSIIILRCLASSSLALISALSLVRLGSRDLCPATSDFGCLSLASELKPGETTVYMNDEMMNQH